MSTTLSTFQGVYPSEFSAYMYSSNLTAEMADEQPKGLGELLIVARARHGEGSVEPRERNPTPTKHHSEERQSIHFRSIDVKPTVMRNGPRTVE